MFELAKYRVWTTLMLCLAGGAIAVAAPAVPDGMTVIDLQQLKEGETREFGGGEHKITATRTSDKIVITMLDPDAGDSAVRTLTCTDGDRCLVMLGDHNADAADRMILIKSSDDVDGESKESEAMLSAVFAGGDDPPRPLTMVIAADGDDHGFSFTTESSESGDVVEVGRGVLRLLRCPHGDTTMTVGKDEAESGFRCPRHGDVLVGIGEEHGRHEVIERRIIKRKGDAAGK